METPMNASETREFLPLVIESVARELYKVYAETMRSTGTAHSLSGHWEDLLDPVRETWRVRARHALEGTLTVEVQDSGGAIDLPVQVAQRLVDEGVLFRCEGACGSEDDDPPCECYHVSWSALEDAGYEDVAPGNDDAAWRVVDGLIEQASGMRVDPHGLPYRAFTRKVLVPQS